ncbi:YcbK family protein [Devosia sp.]|uniref:YcbK family protein n=1 Tax=Devosia sp. TaxID=1871048 RepID=UPI003A937AA9
MKNAIAAALCAVLLSGCLPFSPFASSGNLYKGYKQSFGTYVTSSKVNAFCLSPKLRTLIWDFENHFGRKIVMNSGYRDPFHNSKVGGARSSYHMKCMAADFFIPGVSKRKLIAYAARNSKVGGLGCYPGRNFIHVDVRDRPRGWRKPVTFSGC